MPLGLLILLIGDPTFCILNFMQNTFLLYVLIFVYAQACAPAPDWGPYLKKHREGRYANMQDPKESEMEKEKSDKWECNSNPSYYVNDKTEHTKM